MHLSTELQFALRNPHLAMSNRENQQILASAPKITLPASKNPVFSKKKTIQIKKSLNTTAKPRNGAASETRKYGESRAA